MNIKTKSGEFTGKLLLVITILLISLWLVSALNESSNNNTNVGILPVEENNLTKAPVNILPVEPEAQEIPFPESPSESPTSAAISIQPIVPDDQNVPVENPIITVPETPVEVAPPVQEVPTNQSTAPSLLSTFLNLVLDKVKFFVGEVIEIRATLTDQNSNPLPDKKVDFYADEQIIGSNITDIEGTARVNWNTSSWMPGAYQIKASYAGDESSEAVSAVRSAIIEGDNVTQPEVVVPNVTVFTGEMPKFPFQFKDPSLPDNFSNLRPELIENNKESHVIKDQLEAVGYVVPAISFGLDKEGYYIFAALVETKSGNYEAESKEVFEALYSGGYADYYGVEVIDITNTKFVDYYVSRSILSEFLSNKVPKEEFLINSGAKVNELPPPVNPHFPRTWRKMEVIERTDNEN